MKADLQRNIEIQGESVLGRKLAGAVLEAMPASAVRGLSSVVLLDKHGVNAPLGRYYAPDRDRGIMVVFMRWFKDLERFGVQVCFGRTIVHEVGHNKATKALAIDDGQLNEMYARSFEAENTPLVKRVVGTDEDPSVFILNRPID